MFKQYYIPIFISLATKIIILYSIPILTSHIIPGFKSVNIWEVWNVWDSPHYVSIATSNYHWASNDEAVLIGFLPFLPLTMYLFKLISHTSVLASGYFVSAISTILLSIVLYKLVLLDYPKRVAVLTVLMLFIFPTSFFLHIPYTESLFILLAVSAFYFARKKYYWISFLCIALGTFTKIVGLALLPAILVEIFINGRENFKSININYKLTIILFGSTISLSGFLIYLFINYNIFGDPFYFNVVKKQFHSISFAPFGEGLIGAFSSLSYRVGTDKFMLGYAQIAAFVLGLIMSIYTLIKVRLSYGIYMIIVLWLSYVLSFWTGMPRFILPLFPMFIVLTLFSRQGIFKYLWILFSISLLIFFSVNFIQWGPVL